VKTYVQPGDVLELTAPGGGVVSGTGLLIGALFVVPTVTAAAGAKFSALVTGVVEHAKVSAQAWTEGQRLYWNAGLSQVTSVSTDGTFIGVAAAAAVNPSPTGKVLLAGTGAELVEGQQPANPDTSAATLANLEIEVNELKQLLRNVGLMA
jgi:predicted RecA/RadA family phage recombinase